MNDPHRFWGVSLSFVRGVLRASISASDIGGGNERRQASGTGLR
jgi:hypothetical protein